MFRNYYVSDATLSIMLRFVAVPTVYLPKELARLVRELAEKVLERLDRELVRLLVRLFLNNKILSEAFFWV